MTTPFAPAPSLTPFTQIVCEVAPIVSLGDAPFGERRFVPLGAGTARGPGLNGTLIEGGVDWQIRRADGVLEIAAHYVIRAEDGGLVEVQSNGLRHGSAEVMARLARGEPVGREEVYFRTAMRFTTGAPAWGHLNRMLALAWGTREASRVLLDVYRVD